MVDPTAVVGGPAHGRVLGSAARHRGSGYRHPHVTAHRCGGLCPLAPGADHHRFHFLGDTADDAGPVGAAAGDPGAGSSASAPAGYRRQLAANARRPRRSGPSVDGRGQRGSQPGRVPAGDHLVGLSPTESSVATFHGLVAAGLTTRGGVVGGCTRAARPDKPTVSGLHRVLGRHHPVDVADRGVARNVGVDAVRGTRVHRGVLAGVPASCGAGHHAGRRRWTGRAGIALDAGPGPTGDHADGRPGVDHGRLFGRTRRAPGQRGAVIPGRSRGSVTQRAQDRTSYPDTAGARHRPSAGANPPARQRLPAGMGTSRGASGEGQANGRRDRGADRAAGRDVAGLDRQADPAGHIPGHPGLLAPGRRLAHRKP